MKLALIGGAGVRSPLFVSCVLRRTDVPVDELWLIDTDPERLRLFGAIAQNRVRAAGSALRMRTTTDAEEGLEGAAHIVTTIRVGGEAGRVADEAIALRHGVLGQETTGPGGFAMAARSIPAALGYAELAERVAPGAWTYNFTNPAGLVAQALQDRGFTRTVGICDGANNGARSAARFLQRPIEEFDADVFGLNHLSWATHIRHLGSDVLPKLLCDPAFLTETSLGLFERELVEQKGLWINEYLYYFYYAREAVEQESHHGTRAVLVQQLNAGLLSALRKIDPERDPEGAEAAFSDYLGKRRGTYMDHERYGAARSPMTSKRSHDGNPEEGYAGVAFDVIEAMTSGDPKRMALNVPNAGAIDGFANDDVVEVSCIVDGDGPRSRRLDGLPRPEIALAGSVKVYERLAVRAILEQSRALAVEALMSHPLVPSRRLAAAMVADYVEAHRPYLDHWH